MIPTQAGGNHEVLIVDDFKASKPTREECIEGQFRNFIHDFYYSLPLFYDFS